MSGCKFRSRQVAEISRCVCGDIHDNSKIVRVFVKRKEVIYIYNHGKFGRIRGSTVISIHIYARSARNTTIIHTGICLTEYPYPASVGSKRAVIARHFEGYGIKSSCSCVGKHRYIGIQYIITSVYRRAGIYHIYRHSALCRIITYTHNAVRRNVPFAAVCGGFAVYRVKAVFRNVIRYDFISRFAADTEIRKINVTILRRTDRKTQLFCACVKRKEVF